ncbi:MAG: oligosaccharide flippase family protein, partial [Methermicoccaceae archaeon]
GLNAIREMRQFAIALIIKGTALVTITAIAIVAGYGVGGAISAFVISIALSVLYLLHSTLHHFSITFSLQISTLRSMLSFGLKVMFAGTINEINNNMDIMLVGFFLTSADVGLYTSAIVLATAFWILPLSVQKITFPVSSRLWAESAISELSNLVRKSIRYCTLILVLVSLTFVFFSRDILLIFFSSDFLAASTPLFILLIGTVIRGSLAQPVGSTLSAVGRPDMLFRISLVMIVMNVALDIVLIPMLGIVGAAIATTISLSAGALLNTYLIDSYCKVALDWLWFVKVILLVTSILLAFKMLSDAVPLWVLSPGLLLIYSMMAFTRLLSKDEQKEIKQIAGRLLHFRREFQR